MNSWEFGHSPIQSGGKQYPVSFKKGCQCKGKKVLTGKRSGNGITRKVENSQSLYGIKGH
jgi:hypothetical protein